jgi:hypothetical protein
MPKKPQIKFPSDGDTVPVTASPRVFIAQGTYALDGDKVAVGVNGHLLAAGTTTVKAVGSLISWQRVGRRDNLFNWALLFELPDTAALPDGNYDLLVSAYLGSNTIKTATENNSSSKSEGVLLVTSASAGINITSPAGGAAINGNMFMPYGSFSASTKPDRAVMTETTTGTTYSAGTIFASGDATGYWYAAFGAIGRGTYTLDVLSGAAGNSVTGLTVPG